MHTTPPRNVTLALASVIILVQLVTGCDMFGLFSDDPQETPPPITAADALAGMEVVGGLMDTLFEGAGAPPSGEPLPDFSAGSYPSGMDVSQAVTGERSVRLTVTIRDVTPTPDDGDVAPDVVYNGSATIGMAASADGSELTITMDASITASGSDTLVSSVIVRDAVAVVPVDPDNGPGDPSSMQGTLTVDGVEYDMSRIDTDAGTDDTDAVPNPTDAPYFLMSYWVDNGVDRPQLVYFATVGSWGTIHLSGTGTLRDGATDNEGRSVAVGDNGMIFSTDDGGTWTRRGDGLTTNPLNAVSWANGRWVAAGTDVLLVSDDGAAWSIAWSAGATSVDLHAVSYASGTTWRAAGAAPQNILESTDNGASWTLVVADLNLRPQYLVNQLLWTSDDTPWIAFTGQTTLGAIYDGGTSDTDSDGNSCEWTPSVTGAGGSRAAARFGSAIAATVYDGTTRLRVTTDLGDSWSTVLPGGSPNGYPVDMAAIGNGFLVVTNMGGILRGSADGQTWHMLTDESYGSWGVLFRP